MPQDILCPRCDKPLIGIKSDHDPAYELWYVTFIHCDGSRCNCQEPIPNYLDPAHPDSSFDALLVKVDKIVRQIESHNREMEKG